MKAFTCTTKTTNPAYTFGLDNYLYFKQDSQRHHWTKVDYKFVGHHTGGKSNYNIRLRLNGNLEYNWSSPDNRVHNHMYSKSLGFATMRGSVEHWRAYGVFDIHGGDPKCHADLTL